MVKDVHSSSFLLSLSRVSINKKMLGKLNVTVQEKKAVVDSSGRLPCIVFADFVFSSVLSDKFCFCLENKH